LLIACGGSSKSSSPPDSATTAPSAASTQPQVIEVKAVENGNTYAFSPNVLSAKPGPVLVRYTNPDGNARAHTFELKTVDGSADIVKSDEVQPGQTVELTFTMPADGTYAFLCYMRGHADRGQTGSFNVSKSQG
jgi:plastocyanin